MKKKACVIQFLGSNCDDEAVRSLENVGFETKKIFYKDNIDINQKFDLIFIPGGFSYGDYLRTGAMAANSSIMNDVSRFANKGVFVVGICNGFQILTESKLLDGALIKNKSSNFVCKNIYIKKSDYSSKFFKTLPEVSTMQIAHGEGQYFNTPDNLKKLQDENKIAFYYCDSNGEKTQDSNINGSINSIAGIYGGINKNIIGLMPHPERMFLNGISNKFFESFL